MADDRSINELFTRVYALEIFVVAAMHQLDKKTFAGDLADGRALAVSAFESSKASTSAVERLSRQLDRLERALGL